MLTKRQLDIFQQRGLVRLDGLLPAGKVACARSAVLKVLERQGVWRDGTWYLQALPPSAAPNAGADLVKGAKRAPPLAALMTTEVREAISSLLDGCQTMPLMDYPQLLFTLPNARRWSVPHSIWHLDIPRLPDGVIPGVQMFTFLDTVAPGGGGTLLVAGSHRLLNNGQRIASKHVKRRLKREPYFRELMSKHATHRERFAAEPGRVGDVEVQVVELHGEPGDVYLTDMRLLHTLAPNAARVPRMMLTQRFLREGLRDEIFGPDNSARDLK